MRRMFFFQHPWFELALQMLFIIDQGEQNAIRNVSTTRIKGATVPPGRLQTTSASTSDEDYDEQTDSTLKVIEALENRWMAPIIDIPDVKSITANLSIHTVPDGYMVQYISEVQAIVVALRQSYWDILQGHAEWIVQWYEVHFPDYYACVTKNIIILMSRCVLEYPRKLLMRIRSIKDAFVRSYIMRKPISEVDPQVTDGLDVLLANVSLILNHHRASVEELLERQVRQHEENLRRFCKIPMMDRASLLLEEYDNTEYLDDESYNAIDYQKVN